VIAIHERNIEFFGSFGDRRLQRPKARGGGVYRAELFTHDDKTDQMICPENKRLPFRYFDRQPGRTIRTIRVYSARKEECYVYAPHGRPAAGKVN
jgi:hypothetical protein